MPVIATDPFAGRSGNPFPIFDNAVRVTPSDIDELPFVASALTINDNRHSRIESIASMNPLGWSGQRPDQLKAIDYRLVQIVSWLDPAGLAAVKGKELGDKAGAVARDQARGVLAKAAAEAATLDFIDAFALLAQTITAISTNAPMPSAATTLFDSAFARIPDLNDIGLLSLAEGKAGLLNEQGVLLAVKIAAGRAVAPYQDFTVRVTTAAGNDLSLSGEGSGILPHPVRVRKVWATGTSTYLDVLALS